MKSLIFIPRSSDELILIAEKEWEKKQRQHQDKASWISGYLEGYFSKPVDLKQHDAAIAAKAREEGAKAERERVMDEPHINQYLERIRKSSIALKDEKLKTIISVSLSIAADHYESLRSEVKK